MRLNKKYILKKMFYAIEPYDKWGISDKLKVQFYQKNIENLKENELLISAPKYINKNIESSNKPFVGLVKSENHQYSYWPKFERYLINNNIPYEFLDIKSSKFIAESDKFDIIIWRTLSLYSDQWEATDKIEFLEKYKNKTILPSTDSLWFYEDKVRQAWLFEHLNLPYLKTFISYNKQEILDYIENVDYPIISKDKTSSSATGVRLIKTKSEARNHVLKIFSKGIKLPEDYIKQKNYVIFQEKVPNEGFDLRVIMIGNYYLGYYRFPEKGDFRASGSGIYEKREIPLEVLKLAKKVKESLPKTYMLAVDFLQDSRDMKYYIIETSIFISVESSEQLFVDGVPGRYIEEHGNFKFEKGRYWVQELMIDEIINEWTMEGKQ